MSEYNPGAKPPASKAVKLAEKIIAALLVAGLAYAAWQLWLSPAVRYEKAWDVARASEDLGPRCAIAEEARAAAAKRGDRADFRKWDERMNGDCGVIRRLLESSALRH